MSKITISTLDFLQEIKENNNKKWFEKNKFRYQKAQQELKDFAEILMQRLMNFDASLRDEIKPYVFRIYRDARFAKGRPYKNNLGMLLAKGGRAAMHERAGYYLHLEPGKCFLAGGAYMPPAPWLNDIREAICKQPKEIKKVIESAAFKKHFHLEGNRLKTAPKGFSKDHAEIDLLKYKDFMAIKNLSDKQVLAKDFLDQLLEACRTLYVFNSYLNKCKDLNQKNLS